MPFDFSTLCTVTGMSPAVLTETVWALAHAPAPLCELNPDHPLPRLDFRSEPWDLRIAMLEPGLALPISKPRTTP